MLRHQIDAVGGGDIDAAIGIGGGLDAHDLGQVVQRHIALVEQAPRTVSPLAVAVLIWVFRSIDLLDQRIGRADGVDHLLVDLALQRGDGAGHVGEVGGQAVQRIDHAGAAGAGGRRLGGGGEGATPDWSGRWRATGCRRARPAAPFSWENRPAMVSYCEAAPPADSCSWARNWSVTRWTLAISTPISWPPARQRLLIHHPAGIARRVEIGDVVRHHAERGAVGLERADGAGGDSVQAHGLEIRILCSAQTVASPMPSWMRRFFPAFAGLFTLFGALVPGGRVCRTGRSCPVFLCCAAAGMPAKNSTKSRPKHLARPLRWVLPDHYRIFFACVRQRPSRLAPPAGLHAAQADSNAPKADEASPFALLVGAAAPPAQKPSKTPGNASGGKGDDKPDDGKRHDQANAAQTAQTQTTQTQPAAPAGNSQPPSQPASDTGQSQDVQAATDPNAAPIPGQADLNTAPLPPVPGDTQPVSDAGAGIASDADNVSLWPQSARPQPQTGQPGKPIKTDKSDKKDVSDQPAQPDAATVAARPSAADLQVAAVTPPPAPQTIVPPVTDARRSDRDRCRARHRARQYARCNAAPSRPRRSRQIRSRRRTHRRPQIRLLRRPPPNSAAGRRPGGAAVSASGSWHAAGAAAAAENKFIRARRPCRCRECPARPGRLQPAADRPAE